MSTLITVNDGTERSTSPALVLGYEAEQESQNIVHDIIGGGIGVSLIRPRPRAGTLELFYLTELDAAQCRFIHAAESTFSLSDTELSTIAMTYVVDGSITIRLDDEGRRRWIVSVGYQEVDA